MYYLLFTVYIHSTSYYILCTHLLHTTYNDYTIHLLNTVYIHSLHIISTLSFVITARTIYKFNTVVLIFLYYSYGPRKCESQQSPIVIIYRVGYPRVNCSESELLKKG